MREREIPTTVFRTVKQRLRGHNSFAARADSARNNLSGEIEGRPMLAYNWSNRAFNYRRASSVIARGTQRSFLRDPLRHSHN
jgi:hypothetical protein